MDYEYRTQGKKVLEKVLVAAFLSFAAILLVISFQGVPFPAAFQLVAVFSLVGFVMVVSRCLMRNYVYRVEEKEMGNPGDPPDFTITEIYGHHVSVVCRVSVTDVLSAVPVNRETKAQVSAMIRGKRVYNYTGEMNPENQYLLTVRQEEETVFIRLISDKRLLQAILRY